MTNNVVEILGIELNDSSVLEKAWFVGDGEVNTARARRATKRRAHFMLINRKDKKGNVIHARDKKENESSGRKWDPSTFFQLKNGTWGPSTAPRKKFFSFALEEIFSNGGDKLWNCPMKIECFGSVNEMRENEFVLTVIYFRSGDVDRELQDGGLILVLMKQYVLEVIKWNMP